jgi:NTP pyrophosphatase (non-canonical NTP hydrolase)
MTPNEYQQRASRLAIYPEERGIEYVALGLASEAGEVAGKVKKAIRDGKNWTGEQREEHRYAILGELGDVVWYVSELARQFNLPLEDVMQHNIDKLESRAARGTIQGNGDNR